MLLQEKTMDNKRRHARIPFVEAVQYQTRDTEVHEGTLACDLSRGGIRMNTNDFIPIGSEIVVKIRLAGQIQLVDVMAQVVWIRVIPYSERFQIGLEFIDGKIDRMARIGQYVEQSQPALS